MLAVRGRDNVNLATPNKEPIGTRIPAFSKILAKAKESKGIAIARIFACFIFNEGKSNSVGEKEWRQN